MILIDWEIYQLHQDFLGKLAWPCWKSTKLWRHKMQFGDCRKHFLDFGDHISSRSRPTIHGCSVRSHTGYVLRFQLLPLCPWLVPAAWFCGLPAAVAKRFLPFPPHHLWPLDSAKFSCAHLNLISFLEKIRPILGLLGRSGIPTKSPWWKILSHGLTTGGFISIYGMDTNPNLLDWWWWCSPFT